MASSSISPIRKQGSNAAFHYRPEFPSNPTAATSPQPEALAEGIPGLVDAGFDETLQRALPEIADQGGRRHPRRHAGKRRGEGLDDGGVDGG